MLAKDPPLIFPENTGDYPDNSFDINPDTTDKLLKLGSQLLERAQM